MSSDNGSWIYFVIMVVLSIIGSISKSKDKKRPMLPTDKGPEDSFPPVFFPERTKSSGNIEPVRPVQDQRNNGLVDEGAAALMDNVLPKPEVGLVSDSDGPTVEFNFNDEEEIRKAIIYSEIFKRKYF